MGRSISLYRKAVDYPKFIIFFTSLICNAAEYPILPSLLSKLDGIVNFVVDDQTMQQVVANNVTNNAQMTPQN